MAIYHNSFKIIQRSKGQSSVNAIAYRSAEKLFDERLQKEFDYSRKKNVLYSEIFLPENAPRKFVDRSTLWNENEKVNNRKDAQVARETEVSLPIEFKRSEWISLVKEYVSVFTQEGMIADVAIHDLKNNPHAHIMLTMRNVNENGFGKMNRSWNDDSLIVKWREDWSNIVNEKLRSKGIDEISHKSHKDRGIEDKIPQIHVGVTAHNLSKQGKKLDRVLINDGIKEYNAALDTVKTLQIEYENEIKLEASLNEFVESKKKELLEPIQKEVLEVQSIHRELSDENNSLSLKINSKSNEIQRLEGLELNLERALSQKRNTLQESENQLTKMQSDIEKSNKELMSNFNASRAFSELLSLEQKKKKLNELVKKENDSISILEAQLKDENSKIVSFLSDKYLFQENGKLYISTTGQDNQKFQNYNDSSKEIIISSLKNGSIFTRNDLNAQIVEELKKTLKNDKNELEEINSLVNDVKEKIKDKTKEYITITNETKVLDEKIKIQTEEYLKKYEKSKQYEYQNNRGGFSR